MIVSRYKKVTVLRLSRHIKACFYTEDDLLSQSEVMVTTDWLKGLDLDKLVVRITELLSEDQVNDVAEDFENLFGQDVLARMSPDHLEDVFGDFLQRRANAGVPKVEEVFL